LDGPLTVWPENTALSLSEQQECHKVASTVQQRPLNSFNYLPGITSNNSPIHTASIPVRAATKCASVRLHLVRVSPARQP